MSVEQARVSVVDSRDDPVTASLGGKYQWKLC
jgi:hypothetical protein